jgi:transglutaminase-like putative cysteine protease
MKLKITHTTTYEYHEVVPVCQNECHLSPRNCSYQACQYHRLLVRPTPSSSSKRMDYFGNPVTYFAIQEGHRRLSVTSICKVELSPRPQPELSTTPAWESIRDALPGDRSAPGLSNYQYSFESPHVSRSDELAEYAAVSFTSGRPIGEALSDLTARMHRDFQYDPAATTVSTPMLDAFRGRKGVCQDLAHVQIGCLRSLGLAARYISGYLRTHPPADKPRLVGADASHAWVALYCGSAGWLEADPTNNLLPMWDHVTLAWGRDYSDVCPINGMFVGGGQHTMSVSVNVDTIGAERQASGKE